MNEESVSTEALIALATDNTSIHAAIKSAVEAFYAQSAGVRPFEMRYIVAKFEEVEELEPLILLAHSKAEAARTEGKALIGIGSSCGRVSLRSDKHHYAVFPACMVTATCSSGILCSFVSGNTIPQEFIEAFQKSAYTLSQPFYAKEPDEHLLGVARAAVTTWLAGLQDAPTVTLHRIQ